MWSVLTLFIYITLVYIKPVCMWSALNLFISNCFMDMYVCGMCVVYIKPVCIKLVNKRPVYKCFAL